MTKEDKKKINRIADKIIDDAPLEGAFDFVVAWHNATYGKGVWSDASSVLTDEDKTASVAVYNYMILKGLINNYFGARPVKLNVSHYVTLAELAEKVRRKE